MNTKELTFLHLVLGAAQTYDIESIEFADGIVLQCGKTDPQIYINLPCQLEKPRGDAVCEITYTSTVAGIIQVFWDYGEGLSEENSTKEVCFSISKTKSMFLPIVNWKNDKKLLALRVDPPDGAGFVLKSVRILEEE